MIKLAIDLPFHGSHFEHLQSREYICLTNDCIVVAVDLEGWNTNHLRLWPDPDQIMY